MMIGITDTSTTSDQQQVDVVADELDPPSQ